MRKESFRYHPLSENELQILWKKHKFIIESFVLNNKYNTNDIYINENIVMSIIAKVDQRRRYFKYFHGLDMSEYKEVALICFWYIKLRPICISQKALSQDLKVYDAINEKLAVYYLLVSFRCMLEEKNLSTRQLDSLPKKYLNEVIYSFTYRDISKEALILLIIPGLFEPPVRTLRATIPENESHIFR